MIQTQINNVKLTLLLLSSTCDCIRLNFFICAFLSSYRFDKLLKWLFVEFWDCWLLEDCCCDCWSNKLLFSRNSEILQTNNKNRKKYIALKKICETHPNDGLIDKLSPKPGDITDCWNRKLSFEFWWFEDIKLLIFWLELPLILKISAENKLEWFAVGL